MILKSGKELVITLAPFAASKALWQAVLEEAKGLNIQDDTDLGVALIKDLFCVGFSSKKIEAALDECLKRATYAGLKIDADTFEKEEARADYIEVCYEVAKANLLPFTKSLYAQFSPMLEKLKNSPA